MVALSFLSIVSLAVTAFAAHPRRVACPDGKNTATNAACCAFFSLRDDLLANLFDEGCSEEVHESLRLTFHDAVSFSPQLFREGKFGGGGADGSVLVFPDVEANFAENLGISNAIDFLTPFLSSHNVSAGDLVQFAAAVGLSQCPGAPVLEFLAGRPNATAPPPDGLIPQPQDSVTSILERFGETGIDANEVIALLASHSVARADHVDPTIQAAPFDSTPFTFDTQLFLEVLLNGTGFPGTSPNVGEVASPLPQGMGDNVGELRLQSDFALARDPRTACTWQSFVNEQEKMASAFQQAMKKLAIIGHSRNSLIDCSEAVPANTAGPVGKPATFPATKSQADVQQACNALPFPTLSADAGPATDIPHCPDGTDDCGDS